METFGLWLLKYSCACRHVWVGFMLGFAGLLDRWQSVENISGSLQINMLLIPSHHMRWGLSLKWNSRYAILYIPIGKWNNVFSLKHHSFGLISLCYQILLLFFFFFLWVGFSVLWWLAKSVFCWDQGMLALFFFLCFIVRNDIGWKALRGLNNNITSSNFFVTLLVLWFLSVSKTPGTGYWIHCFKYFHIDHKKWSLN